MVDSTSFKAKLIDFDSMQCQNSQQSSLCNSAFNSFMIKIDDFSKYQQVQQLTGCQNCKGILTEKDYDYIDDWNLIEQNQKQFADIPEKIKIMRQDPWSYYIWQCRFCAHKNLIKKDKAIFVQNKSKVVIRDALPKEYQPKNFCESPLLLFLIDSSSSMDEGIQQFSNSKNWTKQTHYMVDQMLKKTKVYQKILKLEEERLKNIWKVCKQEIEKQEFKDHLTKNKVLMSLLQLSIKDIKDIYRIINDRKKLKNMYRGKQSSERKVGFIYFNSDVIIHKQNAITVSDKAFKNDTGSTYTPKVNFNSFRELYELGLRQSQKFGIDISKFSFDAIDIQRNLSNPSGQTALGPAMAIASGIVTNFGPGSLVVVITDGKANKGIFKQDQLYNNQINLLNMKFEKAKTQICVIQLDHKQQQLQKKQIKLESSLSKYFRKYCQRILIQLDNKQSPFQIFRSRLKQVINKTKDRNVVNEISISCQNPNIDYNHNLNNFKRKLFSNKQYQFMAPKMKIQNFKAIDYKFPFMTQILIKYQDIQTKKQQICLTFMVQKIIKYKQMTRKERQVLNSPDTLMNVLSYFNKQEEKLDLVNIPLSMSQLSFKSMIEATFTMSVNRQNKINLMKDFDQDELNKEQQTLKFVQKNPKQLIKQYQIRSMAEQYDVL